MFEVVTVASFALIVIRRRSKKRVRHSQRLSELLRSAPVFEVSAPFQSPRTQRGDVTPKEDVEGGVY